MIVHIELLSIASYASLSCLQISSSIVGSIVVSIDSLSLVLVFVVLVLVFSWWKLCCVGGRDWCVCWLVLQAAIGYMLLGSPCHLFLYAFNPPQKELVQLSPELCLLGRNLSQQDQIWSNFGYGLKPKAALIEQLISGVTWYRKLDTTIFGPVKVRAKTGYTIIGNKHLIMDGPGEEVGKWKLRPL